MEEEPYEEDRPGEQGERKTKEKRRAWKKGKRKRKRIWKGSGRGTGKEKITAAAVPTTDFQTALEAAWGTVAETDCNMQRFMCDLTYELPARLAASTDPYDKTGP